MKKMRFILWLCVFSVLLPGCKSAYSQPETTLPASTETVTEILPRNPGKLRIPYTGNHSSVRYITEASQLPNNEVFVKYDDAFFQKHALLLVTDTVGSGSTQISIDVISVDGNVASVTLLRTMPGDAGTSDMATWLLWAEVPAGLELPWKVANPAVKNDSNLHTS